jgi:hypothetical protein
MGKIDRLVPTESAELMIDAAVVAPRLGLSPARFMAELKRGHIYQTTEQGRGQHEGRYRVTFHYRARTCRIIIVGPDGDAVMDV